MHFPVDFRLYNKVVIMLDVFKKVDVRLSQSPLSNSILFSRFFSLFSDKETKEI